MQKKGARLEILLLDINSKVHNTWLFIIIKLYYKSNYQVSYIAWAIFLGLKIRVLEIVDRMNFYCYKETIKDIPNKL